LKKCLGGKRFANNEEVQSAVDGYFEELDYSHYKQGIKAIGTSLGKVYRAKRRLCREIKKFFSKMFFFSFFLG
jgi:hypothetical protein